jgi:ring-1,2-phenylacetyl-CoA epoxidase subunit PaaE
MGLFNIFKKKETNHISKGFFELAVSDVKRLNDKSVMVSLEIPDELKSTFQFTPGQYLNFEIEIGGKKLRRSYSICSGINEPLSVAVKAIENGKVSNWFNTEVKAGTVLHVGKPEGNFKLDPEHKNVVSIAAGSGITPILSIAKSLGSGKMNLYYGNRTLSDSIFIKELKAIENVLMTGFLSQEENTDFKKGRIDKDAFKEIIKSDLDLLKADAFFICGPEGMIHDVKEVLKFFGVTDSKIKFELFTAPTPVDSKPTETEFKGISHVKVILDHETVNFDIKPGNSTILDYVEKNGLDAPYSCRGGVCCSCKAKVLEGQATMRLNYSLTDEEVKNGYILTCQAHPASENLTISYDE